MAECESAGPHPEPGQPLEPVDASRAALDRPVTSSLVIGDFDSMYPQGLGISVGAAVRRVQHVAGLREWANADSLVSVISHGCITAGDGGDGLWRWDAASTAVDNTGTVIKPTALASNAAGRWLRVNTEEVWVKWFGAKGDGITDDTAAIQAALDYAMDQMTTFGRLLPVWLNDGTYKITDTLKLYKRRTVQGAESYRTDAGVSYTVQSTYQDFYGTTVTFGAPASGYNERTIEIKPTFKDRPALIIQSARYTNLKNFSVKGLANSTLSYYPSAYEYIAELQNPTWWNYGNAKDTQYAPYCGIAIDPFCRLPPSRIFFSADDTPPTGDASYTPLRDDLWYIGPTNGPFELRQLNAGGVWVTLKTNLTLKTAIVTAANGLVPPPTESSIAYGDIYQYEGVKYYWDNHLLRKTTNTYPNTHHYYGFRDGGHYESLHDQYDSRSRSSSTGVILEKVESKGFICGVTINTSLGEGAPDPAFPGEARLGAQLSDSISLRDCDLSYNKASLVIGQSQSRGVLLDNVHAKAIRTLVDCSSYGQGTGPMAEIRGGIVQSPRELIIGNAGWGAAAGISDLYVEGCGSIGRWGGGGWPLSFNNCTIKFVASEYTLIGVENTLQNESPVVFNGCYLGHYQSSPRRLSFANIARLSFRDTALEAVPLFFIPQFAVFDECKCLYTGQGLKSLKQRYFGNVDSLEILGTKGYQIQGAPFFVVEEQGTNLYVRYKDKQPFQEVIVNPTSPNTMAVSHILMSEVNSDKASLDDAAFLAKYGVAKSVANVIFVGQNSTDVTGLARFTLPYNTARNRLQIGDHLVANSAWYSTKNATSRGVCVGVVKSITVTTGEPDVVMLQYVPSTLPEGNYLLKLTYIPEIRRRTIGTTATGSNVISNLVPSTLAGHGWNVGSRINGTNIPSGSYVTSVSDTQLTISQNVTGGSAGVFLFDAKIGVEYAENVSAPSSGVWIKGDYVRNTAPSKDGSSMTLLGWICTVSGTPGTWEPVYVSATSPAFDPGRLGGPS